MSARMPRRVGLVGGGVIGGGWAARFCLAGADVTIYDPDPEAERKLAAVFANARHALDRLHPDGRPAEGRLRVVTTLEAALDGADFVQESLPEREDLKIDMLAQIDALLPAGIIIGSSTSGLLPSRLQSRMKHPGRLTVGHPFNPVYLLPLVELCGGAMTVPETIEQASAIYESIGMHPLHVRQEIGGFIADRLLEAVWREALHMINDGVATVDEIDRAINMGPGLRWSLMGTFMIYRVAGGEAGMRHFMSQFGPALKLPWTRLEAPELTDELLDRVVTQSDDQAGETSIRDLERLRDDGLVAILNALRSMDHGAGRFLPPAA